MNHLDHQLYRIESDGLGIYAAVERDCPRSDSRRTAKPDGAWLPRVGADHPGGVSYFTETGLAKYWGSGLMGWHTSVVAAPPAIVTATLIGAHRYRDRFQVIADPGAFSVGETLAITRPAKSARRGVILWDFDGTLAASTPLWSRAAGAALAELAPDHTFDLGRLRTLFGEIFPWHAPHRAHPGQSCSATWWSWMEAIFRDAFVAIGASVATAAMAATRIKSVVLDPLSYRVIDGAIPALVTLRDAGWRHVIVSNHVPELPEIVAGLGLQEFFTHVVTSGMVGHEKPSSTLFEHALALAGAADEPVWMIGDNPVADLEGAARLGIPGILVGHSTTLRDVATTIATRSHSTIS